MHLSFTSKKNHLYSIDQHTLVWIQGGEGVIEVDFKTYSDFQNKLIYLAPGQYLKFLIGEFQVKLLEFPSRLCWASNDNRGLFKHLISFGYIRIMGIYYVLYEWMLNSSSAKIRARESQ